MVRIVKRKLRGFFNPDDLLIIKQAVLEHNEIITKVSMLARAYYLFQYENNVPYKDIILNGKLLELCSNIVKGDNQTATTKKSNKKLKENATEEETEKFEKKQEKSLEDKAMKSGAFNQLNQLAIQLFGEEKVKSTCSISTCLDYSFNNLITAYENNIIAHFTKYLKKLIICDQKVKLLEITNQVELPIKELKEIRRKIQKNAAIVTNSLIFENIDDLSNLENNEGITIDVEKYKSLLPIKKSGKESYPYCYHLAAYPMTFLPYMVKINRLLETNYPTLDDKSKKLYNPIPFHSSNVPIHMRLDTSAIANLLMNSKRIKEFKQFYEAKYPSKTLNMTNKGNMLYKYEKLFGKPATSKKEEGEYATEMWNFLTTLEDCKQRKFLYCKYKNSLTGQMEDYVFDNSIVTDGISISFQINKLSEFGRKEFNKKGNSLKIEISELVKEAKKDNKNDETVNEIIISKMKKLLSCDPGKNDIATVTDGITTIAYTRGGNS